MQPLFDGLPEGVPFAEAQASCERDLDELGVECGL